MIHTTQTISALTLLMVSTQSAMADNDLRWREFDPNMSNEEYEDSCRDNQRFIRKFITGYSENALTSVGVPKAGVDFMGVAAGLAAGQNARFYLNDSKLFAVEIKDATQDDRAVFLGVSLDW